MSAIALSIRHILLYLYLSSILLSSVRSLVEESFSGGHCLKTSVDGIRALLKPNPTKTIIILLFACKNMCIYKYVVYICLINLQCINEYKLV